MSKTLAILILAAGQSTRMRGRDKLMGDVGGVPLVRKQAQTALELCDDVTVALPPAPHPRHGALEGLGVNRAVFGGSSEGMGGSLRDGVAALCGYDAIMVLLGDLPDLMADDLRRVLRAADETPEAAIWRGATAAGAPGHPILLSAETYPAFAALRGDDGGRSIVAAFADRTVLVPLPGVRARADLDTPEDWAAWRAQQG